MQPRCSGCKFARLDLIDITPDPGFSGLNRAHERMLGVVKVLGGVLVLGRVTTAHLPADEAHAQVDPGIAHFHALFTGMFPCASNFDLVKMGAFFRHTFLLSLLGNFRLLPRKSCGFGHLSRESESRKKLRLSHRIIATRYFIRVEARLSLLRADYRFYHSGRTPVLGRLAARNCK